MSSNFYHSNQKLDFRHINNQTYCKVNWFKEQSAAPGFA